MAAANAFSQIWSGATNWNNVPIAKSSTIESLAYNSEARKFASKYGLSINTVTWEDTGRTKGSCWGPNISDMTLCVGQQNMPIIRKPNFSDLTSDQEIASFNVTVGNQDGSGLRSIPLKEYLQDIGKYTDSKVSGSLLAERDAHILTSAQACVLPLRDGKVEFAVRLYNYQSRAEPAVLVVIVSSQGTSAHYVLGQENVLDFNKGGLKAKFLAARLRDDRKARGVPLEGPMTEEEKIRNALMIFQIPLKYKAPVVSGYGFQSCSLSGDLEETCGAAGGMCFSTDDIVECSGVLDSGIYDLVEKGAKIQTLSSNKRSVAASLPPRGMDHGILSTTEGNGKFNSLSAFTVERDDRMPIRCTIQYYHVTDESTVSEEDMKTIASEVVRHNPISSLVVDTTLRPTEHTVASASASAPTSVLKKMFTFM